ncbi:peptidase inhibitor family I36 protein [Sphaerisporangium aureirubrum]|uniref:Peptidase inhibitor family I36 protein n=1 Tax=Sphaerisporangium aureirubrum TaxID=1544736 RepID=A0ABW1NF01_9ACTN
MVSLSTAAVLGGAVATPAMAASAQSLAGCEFTRTLCLFDQVSYNGERFTAQSLSPTTGACVDLVWHGWGGTRAKSSINTNSRAATLYSNTNCTGASKALTGSNPGFTFSAGSVFVY